MLLEAVHDLGFVHDIMDHGDAGDLGEGAGQHAGLVLVGADRLGEHEDPPFAQARRGADEELHLRHPFVERQGGGAELHLGPASRGGKAAGAELGRGRA